MKLGIFDSGLGGLIIAKAIRQHMPDLDMVYLGDTLRLPYGNRSDDVVYHFTESAMRFLFDQGCSLIVIACNTASARALRRLQQQFLPNAPEYKGRNIIGVVVPTLEAAIETGTKHLGVIGTNYTISSNVYAEELGKIAPAMKITQVATPLLVPLIENDGRKWAHDILKDYLAPMKGVEALILGCTHYSFLRDEIAEIINVPLLCQDDIIPAKLEDYIKRHPEYKITRGGSAEFLVSDDTPNYRKAAEKIYSKNLDIRQVAL